MEQRETYAPDALAEHPGRGNYPRRPKAPAIDSPLVAELRELAAAIGELEGIRGREKALVAQIQALKAKLDRSVAAVMPAV